MKENKHTMMKELTITWLEQFEEIEMNISLGKSTMNVRNEGIVKEKIITHAHLGSIVTRDEEICLIIINRIK